jgi:excisionase family DNA binding protein
MPIEKRVLTVEEAAQELRCSKWLVYDLIQSGALRAVRVGRLWRVPRGSIRDYLGETQEEAR